MVNVHKRYSLKRMNSFGIEASALTYASPEDIGALSALLDNDGYTQLPLLIMGEGSNMLFKGNFEGLIIRPGMKGMEVCEEDEQEVLVKVGASENWDHWVAVACKEGWHGLENLSLIPGSVGSAPVQNIGAYGVELKDHFEWLEAWDLQLKCLVRLDHKECNFGYRSSIFKHEFKDRYIICQVCFRLLKKAQLQLDYGPVKEAFLRAGGASAMDLRTAIISIRKQKLPDPEQFGNAGSFFKNPLIDRSIYKCLKVDYPSIPGYPEAENQVKIPAAWLIEEAGWKGKRIGNVGTWPTQALVIVNYGDASGQEILDFSEQLRRDVEKQFGIWLEREVNVIG